MAGTGGKREGSGRKKKSDEQALIDALSPYDALAQEKLIEGVTNGSVHHLKLFYEYRYGKPKQLIGVVTESDTLEQVFKIGGVEITL
jgi:hypothetical protein